MQKLIFIYWEQKFINAPNFIKKCLLSWKLENPTWKIIEINQNNLKEYIDIETEIPNCSNKEYNKIIGVFLLEKYGGCWCNSTTFCNQSLDDWLNDYISSGFFAFSKQAQNLSLSNCFLYSEKNHYIIQEWKKKIINYYNYKNQNDNLINNDLLLDLYNTDDKFKKMCDLIPKKSVDNINFICQFKSQSCDLIKYHIDNVKSPIYNISPNCNKNLNFKYLLNKNVIKLLHIGKCGGTTISYNFKIPNALHDHYLFKTKPVGKNDHIVLWLRNPITRIISAFNFAKYLIKFDCSKIKNVNTLNIQNNIGYERIRGKINLKTKYMFSQKFDYLITYFNDVNDFLESLSSNNLNKKNNSNELIKYTYGNKGYEYVGMFLGYSYHLNNGQFIENNHKKIKFVGTCENMDNDMNRLSDLLNIKSENQTLRKNNDNNNKNTFLSQKAIQNFLNEYEDTDYKALKKLVKYNLITEDLLQTYYHY